MMKALLVTRMATCVEAAEISQLVIKGDAVECESEDDEPEEEITYEVHGGELVVGSSDYQTKEAEEKAKQ